MTKGYFKLRKRCDGQWMFNLHAGNGEVIATSEGYASRRNAERGIASVQANGSTTKKIVDEN
ncbi:MAG: YegP family protein [Alphaproteobacteria bacterium]